MTPTVGIIGAELEEILDILLQVDHDVLHKEGNISLCKCTYHKTDIVIALGGIGKVSAAMTAQTLIDRYGVERIIVVGTAGAIHSGLNVDDCVIGDNVIQYDFDLTPIGLNLGYIPAIRGIEIPCNPKIADILQSEAEKIFPYVVRGNMCTGDRFVADEGTKELLTAEFSALTTDMESAAIGQVCKANGIPFAVIRVVSDTANGESTRKYFDRVDRSYGGISMVIFNTIDKIGKLVLKRE